MKTRSFCLLCWTAAGLWLLSAAVLSAQSVEVKSEPSPGLYGGEITVSLSAEGEEALYYRFAASDTDEWLPYRYPVRLPAAEGDERRFTLEVGRSTADGSIGAVASRSYTIDSRAPAEPEISLSRSDQGEVRLDLSVRGNPDIFYWHSALERMEYQRWEGGTISISRQSLKDGAVTVQAYARDDAGNRSEVVSEVLPGERSTGNESEIILPSPAEGSFVNPQLLYVANSECFKWVRYTVNGADPVYRGAVYREPVLLRARGDYQLRIAARREDGSTIRKQRQFRIEEETPLLFDFESGLLDRPVSLTPPDKKDGYVLYYTRQDRPVTEADGFFRSPVELFTDVPVLQRQPIRIGVFDPRTDTMHQYRYFFLYDNRVPGPPRLEISGRTPFQDTLEVRIEGPNQAELYYTLDGSTPDEFSERYEEPIRLEAPRGVDTGSIRIQAIAQYPNNKRSPVTSRLVEYDTSRPGAPEAVIEEKTASSAVIRLQSEGASRYRYEIAVNGEPPMPTVHSPRCTGRLELDFPRGLSAPVSLKAAAEDRAGNLSAEIAELSFRIDTIPPEPPRMTVRNGTVILRGEGDLYVLEDYVRREAQLSDYPSAKGEFSRYEGEMALEGKAGEKRVYRVWAYAEDEAGNRSRIVSSEPYTVDRRSPTVPKVVGTTERNVSNEPVTVSLASEAGEGTVEYRLTVNPQKAGSDQERGEFRPYRDPLRLEGEPGARTVYLLEYRGRIGDRGEASDVRSERFVIDRQPPEPPRLRGIEDGGHYARPPLIRGSADGGRVWVWTPPEEELERVRESAPGDGIAAETIRVRGRLAEDGVLLSCPEGEEAEYAVLAVSCDPAGNCTPGENTYRITLDRKKPELPELRGGPEAGITAENVRLVPQDGDYAAVTYELSRDGSWPPVPSPDSARAEDELRFTGKDGERVEYTIRYRAVDEAGNLSSSVGSLHWTIDRRRPREPDIVTRQIGPSLFSVELRGEMDRGTVLYTADGGRYREYGGPFFHRIADEGSRGTIQAYTESTTGVQSGVTRTALLEVPLSVSLLKGLRDGAAYGRDVRITPRAEEFSRGAELRYELRLGGENASTNPFSPLFPDTLRLSALEGQKAVYRLSVGIHSHELPGPLRSESYRVTVDKAAPPVPSVEGLDGRYFTEPQRFRFRLPEDEGKIRYSLSPRDEPIDSYTTYDGSPLEAGGAQGTMREYRLSFFAVDAVGNRSETRELFFTVDRDGIYVSSAGSDRGSGGRAEPFRSLERALQEAETSNRSTIVLAEGEYRLHAPLRGNSSLTIKGGYRGESWEASGAQSVVSLADDFPGEGAIIELSGGSITLERVLLNSSERNGKVLSLGSGSEAELRESTLVTGSGGGQPVIEARDAVLRCSGSRIDLGPVSGDSALRFNGSRLELRNASITSGKHEGDTRLLYLEESRAEFSKTVIDPGAGRQITALELRGGRLEDRGSTLYAGPASLRSTVIRSEGGELELSGTKLLTGGTPGGGGRIVTGLLLQGGKAALNECSLRLSGYAGAVAVKTEDAQCALRGSTLRTEGQGEFAYQVRAEGGELTAENSLFVSGASFDTIMFELRGADASFRHATMVHGGGDHLANALRCEGGSLRISSSVLAGGGAGSAIILQEAPEPLAVEENIFSGWPLLLRQGGEVTAVSIEELEQPRPPYRGQAPFGGNSSAPRNGLFTADGRYLLRSEEQRQETGYHPSRDNAKSGE